VHVLATAGHVDHGKSTLVRALTGAEPDRLAEEHRRGLSIELGFCWTTLPGVGDVAFVDVPGHERFLPTMLAGVGSVPAVVFVVAADDAWMPQAAEHLAVLDALEVRHGLLVVTRCDLADPEPAAAAALARLRLTTLGDVPVVCTDALHGQGLEDVRSGIAALVATLPDPEPDADVRLWLDRDFTLTGTGTVVTGTLPAGSVRVGDTLMHGEEPVQVRRVQVLGRDVPQASAVARVALQLRGAGRARVRRGSALVTPHAWLHTDVVDVALRQDPGRMPQQCVLHIGSTAVACRLRRLDDRLVRLHLGEPLPLRVGDRAVLRDPGSRLVRGMTVLDPLPPPLDRRGAPARRAAALRPDTGRPVLAEELRRRRVVRASLLRRIGVPVTGADKDALQAGDWLVDRSAVPELSELLRRAVVEHTRRDPLGTGLPVAAATRLLGLPDAQVTTALVAPPLRVVEGRIRVADHGDPLPAQVAAALDVLEHDLADRPFAAPNADRLTELGLDARALAAAERAGRLMRLAPGVVLLPEADERAAHVLGGLSQPFTAGQARTALETSRRVVLALLARLDAQGRTVRLRDDTRRMTAPEPADDRTRTGG